MAKTASSFIDYIRESDYPTSLSDVAIERAFNEAVMDCGAAAPAIRRSVFNIVQGQDVYDVFNRAAADPPPAELVDSNGYRASIVTWSVQPDHSGDPFFQGPFFGPYNGSPLIPYSTSGSWRATDSIIFDSQMASVREEFLDAWFENVDSDPKSPIRLFPVPESNGVAGIQYYAYRDTSEYVERAETAYTHFAESRVCRAIARKKSMTADVKFGPIDEGTGSMKFWMSEADRLFKQGLYYLERASFLEIPSAQRGGSI